MMMPRGKGPMHEVSDRIRGAAQLAQHRGHAFRGSGVCYHLEDSSLL
jgi:hypothetical protein